MTKPWLMATLAIEAMVSAALAVVVADVVAHRHVERLGGVNIWGYRGTVMPQPKANEIRIAVAGGDLAFGWGVAVSETLVYGIRQLVSVQVDRRGGPLRRVTAVNIGAAGLPISGYAGWIERFAYLRPAVICLVVDPIGRRNVARWQLPDRRSAIFARFGYSPILPLVLEEKGAIVRSRALERVGRAAAALDRSAGPAISYNGDGDAAALTEAVRAALGAARSVVVVAPPSVTGTPAADAALHAAAAREFVGNPRVRFVALGGDPSMRDPGLTLDGFDFSAGGHAVAAGIVTPVVLDLIGS